MRPYLAVIHDSFLEAFKSRMLWILLAAWTVLLGLLSPFGWIEGTDFNFRSEQIIDSRRLISELKLASRGRGSEAQRYVWERLDEGFQNRIKEFDSEKSNTSVRLGTIAESFSKVLTSDNLYTSDAWPFAAKLRDLEMDLADYRPKDWNADRLARVNRKLIELAFPASLKSVTGNSYWVGYAKMKLFGPIPVSRDQLRPFIEGVVLIMILKIALGVVGIMIAVVVTSNLIPDMFAPGSMALLLSKPISRSGLLMAKFFGGVCFILINVSYLLIGFYFILGWRMEIWNGGLLLCIPLFLFVFMIFYSVSTLVGLIWKNAIISIISVVLFWSLCFVVGFTNGQLREFVVDRPSITKLRVFDGHLMGSNREGELLVWDEKSSEWKPCGGQGRQDRRILGPLWLPDEKLVIYGRPNWSPFIGLQSDGIQMYSLDVNDDAAEDSQIAGQPIWSETRINNLPELPSRTRRIGVVSGRIIVVSENGIYRMDLNAINESKNAKTLFGFKIRSPIPTSSYPKLTLDEITFETPIDFCTLPDSDDLLVLSKNRLQQFRFNETDKSVRLELQRTLELDLPDEAISLVSATKATCFVMTNKKQAQHVDLSSWQASPVKESKLTELEPLELEAYGTDRFVMQSVDGKLIVFNKDGSSADEIDELPNKATAMALSAKQELYVASLGNRVDRLSADLKSTSLVCEPKWSTAQWIYWMIVRPIYLINPKPAAVDVLIQEALSDGDPIQLTGQTSDLEQVIPVPDLWEPLWHNTIFIIVVLSISCWYLNRQDS